jgi:3-deoxy-7-phosphoheptulonate synthase
MPNYEDEEELEAAVNRIKKSSPLVFAGEVRSLHEQLARACQGQGFLLMGGDCAEAFKEFNVDHVRDTFRVILQMALVLTFGGAMPVIKVGRMAGQFAKPRSEPDEVIDGVALPSYRGDIINSEEFTKESRRHNPMNMVEAYHQSAQTLNILRAFSTGGYADISRLHAWNLDFVEQTDEGSRYVHTHIYIYTCCLLESIETLYANLLTRFSNQTGTASSPTRSTSRCAS